MGIQDPWDEKEGVWIIRKVCLTVVEVYGSYVRCKDIKLIKLAAKMPTEVSPHHPASLRQHLFPSHIAVWGVLIWHSWFAGGCPCVEPTFIYLAVPSQ